MFENIKLMILTGLIVTMPVMAKNSPTASANEDWKTIKSDRDIKILQPSFSTVMGPEGIFNTCATPTEYKSINPVANCEDYKIIQLHGDSGEFGKNKEFICTQVSPGQISISRATNKSICEESVSIEDEDKNATCIKSKVLTTLPVDLKLEIVKGRGEAKGQSLFVKNYQIPKC